MVSQIKHILKANARILTTGLALLYIPTAVSSFSSHTQRSSNIGLFKTAGNCLKMSSSNNNSNGNPFTSMLGDMASSLLGGKSSATANPNLDSTLTSLGYSWDQIQSSLESKQSPAEQSFRSNLSKGYGEGSPLHSLRLFDESNDPESVRVTFYRDSASWCPYSQKVWVTLEEKRIPYKIEKVNMRSYGEKTRDFLRMQPSGNIPVAIIDGQTYRESADILAVLERQFPTYKSLLPPKGRESRASELLRLERQLFSVWMRWLTTGANYKEQFKQVLQEVDSALASSGGPFFMGQDITVVDVAFLPFLERMCASLLYYKGFMIRVPKGEKTDYPAVNRWFDALDKTSSYQLTKSDYYTHCWDLPPQLGGCVPEPEGEPYRNAIDGGRTLDGTMGSWELPLQPNNGGVEPDWEFAGDEEMAKREAVERLSSNFDAIVKFAARGAGQKGMPPYMAPLADPNAVPNDAVQEGVNCVLQVVSMALLDGIEHEDHKERMKRLAEVIVEQGGENYANGVINSISYLRDRVGVPRDMRLPAARQLRAHLNWSIGNILDVMDNQ